MEAGPPPSQGNTPEGSVLTSLLLAWFAVIPHPKQRRLKDTVLGEAPLSLKRKGLLRTSPLIAPQTRLTFEELRI